MGAPLGDGAGADAGSAYLFERHDATWSLAAELVLPGAGSGDRAGWSVALEGGLALLGTPGDDDLGAAAGAVHVFEELQGQWLPTALLLASDGAPQQELGTSLALDGARLLAGAPGHTAQGPQAGGAYLFLRHAGGWSELRRLLPEGPSAGAQFGSAAALPGGHAAVGLPLDGTQGTWAGAAHSFCTLPGIHSVQPPGAAWYLGASASLVAENFVPGLPAQLELGGALSLGVTADSAGAVAFAVPPGLPGAGPVELVLRQGELEAALPGGWSIQPSLSAALAGGAAAGAELALTVASGQGGLAWFYASLLPAGPTLPMPGAHHGLELDLASSALLGSAFLGATPTWQFAVPPGAVPPGLSLTLQAFTWEDGFWGSYLSFTNAVSVSVP